MWPHRDVRESQVALAMVVPAAGVRRVPFLQVAENMAKRKKHKQRMMRNVPRPIGVEVGSSRVGFGLYARCEFDKEERLAEVGGEVIYDPNYESDYCIELTKHETLEPAEPFRFLNHSCEPNCELVWEEVQGDMRVYVEALRCIAPGEELTIDYAWPRESAIPCHCQSTWCRGWVVDEEELPQLLASLAREEVAL